MRKKIFLMTFILLIAFFTTLHTNVNAAFEYGDEEVNPGGATATSARITTRYIDVVSRVEIAPSTSKVYPVGDTYNTSSILIDGYKLEVTPANATGTVIQAPLTITYEYRKQLTVTTNYVDKTTGTTIKTTSKKYPQGEFYNSIIENIPGYKYIEENSGNTSGNVDNTNIDITYYYKKNDCKVTTKHVDVVTGAPVYPDEIQTGLEGESYKTAIKEDNDRYTLEVVPLNATGVYKSGEIVVTYKYRKKSYVTTIYKDIVNNQEIYARNVQDLKQGQNYSTETRYVTGYSEVGHSGDISGIVGAEDIVITYNYKKLSDQVITKHIDVVTGKEIATSDVQTGLEGEDYTTNSKTINKYVLETTPSNSVGQYKTTPIDVVYEYRKQPDVTTRYVDAVSGEDIINPYTDKILQETAYQTDGSKTFTGYSQTGNSGNTSGVVGANDIVVVYYYKKDSNPVYTRFIDICGRQEIEKATSQTGLEGEEYQTAPITIDGYVLEVTPDNSIGEFATEDINVYYEYRKKVNVITKYVDEVSSEEIIKANEDQHLEEDEYETNPVTIEGYTLTSDSGNTVGVVGPDTVVVTYYYKKNSAYVYTHFVDVCTNDPIVDPVFQSGLESMPYNTEPIEIDGYVLEEARMPANKSGQFAVEQIDVYYQYRKQSNVITIHKDANSGEEIEKDSVTYLEEDYYSTNPIFIPGYVLTQSPDNINGTVGREDIEVVYEYKKISQGIIVKYVDKVTNKILDEVYYDGNERDGVNLLAQEFNGYTLTEGPEDRYVEMTVDVQEFVYYYYQNVNVLVNGIDTDNRKVLWEYTVSGVEGEEYTTEPQDVPGYTLVKTPENANGVHARTNTAVYYEYSKKILLGDVNLDGYINAADAAYILDRYKNGDATNQDFLYGDMNGDNILNSTDAAMILDIFKNS